MQTVSDFDEFMEGIITESKLRNKIAQLQEYIRMGITSIKEANDYEKQKVARVCSIMIFTIIVIIRQIRLLVFLK
jgi:hypothetical protein